MYNPNNGALGRGSLLYEATWFRRPAHEVQVQHRCLEVVLPHPWRTLVSVKISLYPPNNSWLPELDWPLDVLRLFQLSMAKAHEMSATAVSASCANANTKRKS